MTTNGKPKSKVERESEAAFMMGQEAFDRGDTTSDCPYESGIYRHSWMRGFQSGRMSARKRYEREIREQQGGTDDGQ